MSVGAGAEGEASNAGAAPPQAAVISNRRLTKMFGLKRLAS
jgi:hypothetical protein